MSAAIRARLEGSVMIRSERAAISTAARKLGIAHLYPPLLAAAGEDFIDQRPAGPGDADDEMIQFQEPFQRELPARRRMPGAHQGYEVVLSRACVSGSRQARPDDADEGIHEVGFRAPRWARPRR